jgi:hypothetical protein
MSNPRVLNPVVYGDPKTIVQYDLDLTIDVEKIGRDGFHEASTPTAAPEAEEADSDESEPHTDGLAPQIEVPPAPTPNKSDGAEKKPSPAKP